MYAYLNGIVAEKGTNELILDVGGVGYCLSVSMTTLQEAPPTGEKMKLYTYFAVRQDDVCLYGFASAEEKNMFLKLVSVTGIGPKLAQTILGSMPMRDLTLAIVMNDVTALSRAPGVGKKTAQRIVLELKDKVSENDFENAPDETHVPLTAPQQDAAEEAQAALQALGYTASEASRALSAVRGQSDSANELVRLALRGMAMNR